MPNNMKAARVRAGMTAQALIDKCRIPLKPPHVSMIEHSVMMPTAPTAMAICEALDASPRDVFADDLAGLERLQAIWDRRHPQPLVMAPRPQGNPELRVRMDPEMREQFQRDIQALGYANFAAWIHAQTNTVHQLAQAVAKRRTSA